MKHCAVEAVPDTSSDELPDLTDELQLDKKRFVTQGAFGVVYRCPRGTKGEVAVKGVTFPWDTSDAVKEKLKRSLRRELGIWRRLDHPNIVPLLGKTGGFDFGFEHDCMVSAWMPRGSLHLYLKSQGKTLLAYQRAQLIKGVASGLHYLHSKAIVHGDLHPGNILIDDGRNARLTGFCLSQMLSADGDLSYLRTLSVHPGAVLWTAPELVYPGLYPEWNRDGKARATLESDIYSCGNIVLFILSGKMPWPDVLTAWERFIGRKVPQRGRFSTVEDGVWTFLEKCWSPTMPGSRPSAEEVLLFVSDTLATTPPPRGLPDRVVRAPIVPHDNLDGDVPPPRSSSSDQLGCTNTTRLQVHVTDPPDLTDTLQQDRKLIIGRGSFGIVYRCSCAQNGEVAVKAIAFDGGIDQADMDELIRKVRRELGLWRRLDHPNIVPFLGTAQGKDFGSSHPCMVAAWMPNGTLNEYIKKCGTQLAIPSRVKLIQGSAAGLEYLHSQGVLHGDFHPGNILIDGKHNARLADFGLSRTLIPGEGQTSYFWTSSVRPGAFMWAAPELLYPDLFPDFEVVATLSSDIYSLGSVILFTLSGKLPWNNRTEMESKLREFKNPPCPPWPVIPDGVWDFVERCWSPRLPRNRPSAQEVSSFSRDKLEKLLQPGPASVINVVLFGTLGCGKSSIINLLAQDPVAPVSTNADPCTKRPQWYDVFIGKWRFRLYDTMGFRLAHEGDVTPLSPYEQAHAVLRTLTDGVHLILLCARKDGIFSSLGNLYRLINDVFYGGRVSVAFIVTHFDTPDEGWWERNQDVIVQRTGIPVRSIPRACITTLQPGVNQSKQVLEKLLEEYATTISPATLHLDLSSSTTTSLHLAGHCALGIPGATTLAEQFNRPLHPYNVILFGETGVGKSSLVNLIVGDGVATVSSGLSTCTLESRSHRITTATQQFLVWDTMGFNGMENGHRMSELSKKTIRLVHDLSGGIDLLMFCKKAGRLSLSEVNNYRLFEEFLCEGQVPVAVVITHLEDYDPMERWWEENSEIFVKVLGGNVIGHACVTSLARSNPHAAEYQRKLLESRLTVHAMLEDCVSSCSTAARSEGISTKRSTKRGEMGRTPKKMTVRNLVDRCGFTKEEAGELVKFWNSI